MQHLMLEISHYVLEKECIRSKGDEKHHHGLHALDESVTFMRHIAVQIQKEKNKYFFPA